MANTQSMTNARADRIEAKIDKISDTINVLVAAQARSDQRIIQVEGLAAPRGDKLVKIEERLDKSERVMADMAVTISAINRVFWVAITGTIVTFIGAYLFRQS